MLIIGCDFHTRYQQIAMAKEETGELLLERRLDHQSGEAHAFYRSLQAPVRVGIEATGPIHWFERLLAELGHQLWIGDSARIRASAVRKQKTDQRDAALILDLLLAKRFPKIRSRIDRKSTRLNSSHLVISYAVFCLKKKKNTEP